MVEVVEVAEVETKRKREGPLRVLCRFVHGCRRSGLGLGLELDWNWTGLASFSHERLGHLRGSVNFWVWLPPGSAALQRCNGPGGPLRAV